MHGALQKISPLGTKESGGTAPFFLGNFALKV
jgi:hypothetical protein